VNRLKRTRRFVALLCCFTLLYGCSPKNEKQTAEQRVSTPTGDWPQEITKEGNRLTYYQPQVDAWTDYRRLDGRVAVVLTPNGGQSVAGMITLQAQTDTDFDDRTVAIHDIRVTTALFPSLDNATQQKMRSIVEGLFPKDAVLISLDRMLAAAEDEEAPGQKTALRTDPPKIFVSTEPAILLLVDGDPIRAPIPETSVEVIVNANWDLFFDKARQQYYLSQAPLWLQAPTFHGPWAIAKSLPPDMAKLPDDWADVKRTIPSNPPANGKAPKVFYSNTAAELIAFDGTPQWKAIQGTNLAYAANTDSDFFIDYSTNRLYYLTSGRWFTALQRTGPWSFASDKLPPDFANIPADSPAADILPSVPGTDEAREAVMMAQIPTLATVNRTEAAATVKVSYQGQPQFKPIENTQLSYAVNTDSKVIKVGDLYYLCFQGVWFMSRGSNGPWETASSIPGSIYKIPSSSPVYNVTYVKVYESTPQTVTCGYTAGYMGTFVLGMAVGATIAYGTGYHYPPYVYWGPRPVPYYVGYPRTYGVGVHYNYYSGGYYAQKSVYGPYGTASRSAWYNPSTGFYGRSATVQTAVGGATVGQAYNPWTGTYGATRQGSNPYSQWGSSVAVRGDQWAQTAHRSNSNGTIAGGRTSEGGRAVGGAGYGGSGFIAQDKNNNMYAGKDGNIYKKDASGNWSKYGSSGWSSVPPPATPYKSSSSSPRQPPVSQTRPSTQPATLQARSSGTKEGSSIKQGSSPQTMQTRPSTGTPQYPSAQSQFAGQGRPSPSQQLSANPIQQPSVNPIQRLDREAAARQRGAQQTAQYQSDRQARATTPDIGTGSSGRARGRRQ
jgi:hypothetical protein